MGVIPQWLPTSDHIKKGLIKKAFFMILVELQLLY